MASAHPNDQDRRARAAVSALFLTNGALFANLIPRLPELKESFGLGESFYGVLVTAWPIGAILAGLAAGGLIRRFGSAHIAVAGTMLTGVMLLLAGISPSILLVALALLVGGAMDAITDVAQNSHGLLVQRRMGRSILNSLHALWSVGAMLGGLMAAAAIALKVPLGLHLGISFVLFSVVALVALKYCLPKKLSGAPAESEPVEQITQTKRGSLRVPGRVILALLALGMIGIAGGTVEDAGNSWATLYLSQSMGAPGAIAASGFIALVGAQFIGRIFGDRMVNRLGQRLVAQSGGVIIALGMGTALLFPSVPGSIAGFAAAGFGVATLVPAVMEEADRLPGLAQGTGLMVVSWLLRVSFLCAPPLVGWIAEHAELRVGLLLVPVAGLVVLLCSPVLSKKLKGKPQEV